jgi:tetratricopeptide (TPR) repeat protein
MTGPNQKNPYIIGRPITEPDLFFGRETLFQFIEDNLNQGAHVILLYGQRRIGKSSVLVQIPNFIHLKPFFFIRLSLEGKSQKPLGDVLFELANDIKGYLVDELGESCEQLIIPSRQELHDNVQQFEEFFLPQVYQVLGTQNPVLLLDEFDVLGDYSRDTALDHFFPYLQSILNRQEKLFIIPVVGRRLKDMPNLLSLFRQAPNREIGLLSRRSAEKLITKPAQNSLMYEPDAIEAIWELSAGHPYFTQVICFAVFSDARTEQRWRINRSHVARVIDRAMEIGAGGLAWFREGLPLAERVMFSAVAEITINRRIRTPIDLLQEYGVSQIDLFLVAQERLLEWGFIQEVKVSNSWIARLMGRLSLTSRLEVTVQLVCRWLARNYPLHQAIWELKELNPEAQALYEATLAQKENISLPSLLEQYEQVLFLNPDHFDALFDLAETYLDLQDFAKAVELYERAYHVDALRTQEGFVNALIGDGRRLMMQGEAKLAEMRFRKALAIDPDHAIAQTVVELIEKAGGQPHPAIINSINEAVISDFLPKGHILHHRYRIFRTLSEDEFGQTYIARDQQRSEQALCIVKCFNMANSRSMLSDTIRHEFHKEVETLRQLGIHDRIPDLLDSFETVRQLFLVYEFVEGQPLNCELSDHIPWSERQIYDLLEQVLKILEFIHSLHVIHRNIKPDHLIRRDSDKQYVMTGFDTTLRELQARQRVMATSVTIAIGTPGYAPPEQLAGKPRFSSDIYALGIVAIQAATTLNPTEFQDDPATGEIIWRSQAPQIEAGLARVLSKMVHPSLSERYQTVHEVLQDFQAL